MRVGSTDRLKRWTAFLELCSMLAPVPRALDSSWDEMNWDTIVLLASAHLVSPAVWPAVKSADEVPSEVKSYFSSIHEMNSHRNQMILDGLSELLTRLANSGVRSVLLKGVSSITNGLYRDPAERILTDVDLLISPEQIGTAERALRSSGYKDAALSATLG